MLTLQSRGQPKATLLVPSALRAPAAPHFYVRSFLNGPMKKALLDRLAVSLVLRRHSHYQPQSKAQSSPFGTARRTSRLVAHAKHTTRCPLHGSASSERLAEAQAQSPCHKHERAVISAMAYCSVSAFGASNPAVEGTAKSDAFGPLRASRSGCPSLLR